MKKILILILALVMGGLSLTGCGGNADLDYIEDIFIENDYEGQLKISYIAGDTAEIEILSALKTAFNDKYPNIRIQLSPINGDYIDMVMRMAPAGNLGDIFWVGDEQRDFVANSGYLANLTPYLEQDKISFDYNLYNEAMMNQGRLYTTGDQYIMPRDYTQVVVQYNKDIFDEYNEANPNDRISYPQNGWTLEDCYQICKKLQPYLDANKPGGQTRYAMSWGLTWTPIYTSAIRAYGGAIFDEEGKLVLDGKSESSANAKTGIDRIVRFMNEGLNAKQDDSNYFYGEAAMALTTKTHMSKVTSSQSRVKNTDYVSYPKMGENEDSPYIPCGMSGYGMFAGSKHKREAFAFLTFMMSEAGQSAIAESQCGIPVMKTFLTDPEKKKLWAGKNVSGVEFNNEAFIYDSDSVLLNDATKDVKNYREHINIMNTIASMVHSYLTGSKTWDAAVAEMVGDLERYL